MYRSLEKRRPTTKGALLEVLLVLAAGIVAVSIYRAWFWQPAGNRSRPTNSDNVQSTAPLAAADADSKEVR